MDILKRLKKKKEKEDSPFSELVKKHPKKEGPKKGEDIEVKPLKVEHESITTPSTAPSNLPPKKEESAFHASGMRELDFDSMAAAKDDIPGLKEDYIKRIGDLIRNDKISDAVNLLDELQKKLIGDT